PPLLYDLTTLQKEANTRYGFSADKTLGIAQTLYEKKHITYPRTGSRYIPEDVAAEIRPLLATLREHPQFGQEASAVAGSEINRRSVDNDKVTDHHALLITDVTPTSLPTEEQTIYDLIAGRMVEAFGGVCIKEVSTARLECGGMEFVAKGTVVREDGWRKVWREPEEQADDTTAALPALQEGDELPVKGCDVERRQTKPHPIHTESSLLAAMETAGRSLTDEAEREAMKDSGIGTPATRAAIIVTLVARDYIRREKKSLVPTDKGLAVYGIVKDRKIADVAMTGGWELALAKIATAEMDAFTFHRGIEVYAAQIAKELLAVKVENTPERGGAVCPRCGKQVVFYPKVAKCQNADCGLTVWRTIARKELTDAQLADLMTKGKTSVIKGFAKSNGETFEAALTLDKEYKTVFDFAPRNKPKTGKGNKRK
uniref:DNA topoisomerase n=1 Tax=Alistipes finegoldii TaxID=214856 RepID=UPI0025B649C6